MVKTKNFTKRIMLFLTFVFFTTPCFAQEKIAITEFKINTDKQLDYLKTAIPEMIFTRLPQKNKEIVKTDDVKSLLTMGFETIITGSYTQIGTPFSLDVSVYDKDGNVKTFYASKENQSLLISAIEEIVKKIITQEYTGEKKEIKNNKLDRLSFTNYKHSIYTFDWADIDGDGKKELICASKNTIYIYNSENQLIYEKKLPLEILIINSGDFNKNLKDEIYITTMRNEDPVTFVLEQGRKGIEKIDEQEIYINVIDDIHGNKILIGQKPAINSPFDNTFFNVVYDGKKLILGEKLDIPNIENLNIYQIIPIKYNGADYYLYIDESDNYKIIDNKGKTIERLKEKYGGSIMGIARGASNQMYNYVPIPARIHLLRKSNTDEILTIKNEGSRLFLRTKKFDRGKVVLLKKDDLSFKEIKESESFDGYISDIQLDKSENHIYISIITENKEGRIVKLKF